MSFVPESLTLLPFISASNAVPIHSPKVPSYFRNENEGEYLILDILVQREAKVVGSALWCEIDGLEYKLIVKFDFDSL